MASGLASTPSSCTWLPAGPSSCLACSMLCVVSGQTVVHSESSKPSMTTLPRNWLSDIGWPNWLTSLMSGADRESSELPRSRFGFISAALEAGLACMPPSELVLLALAPHPASAASTLSRAAAASVPRVRNVFIAKDSLLRSTTNRRRGFGIVADDHGAAVAPGQVAVGQVDHGGHPVAPAEQVEQVQGQPGQPGERAAQLRSLGELDDRGPAPDGGHLALVVVGERLGDGVAAQPDDLRAGVAAHLQRGLGQLGGGIAGVFRDVTHGEDAVLSPDPQVGPDQDAAALTLGQAPARHRPGRP